MTFSRSRQPSGLILLVVLSMLAFLGVLVITYISFSSKSRRTSYGLASREFHAPDVDDLFEEALMKLVRGTDDPSDPFFGEDLLSDLYGRSDGLQLRVTPPDRLTNGPNGSGDALQEREPVHIGGGFVRFPVDLDAVTNWDNNPGNDPDRRPPWTLVDDAFAMRVITFTGGPLENQSFRVLRSTGARTPGTDEYVNADSFFIELDPALVVTLANGSSIDIDHILNPRTNTAPVSLNALFYRPNDTSYPLYVNSAPQNSPGIGLADGTISETQTVAGEEVPVSFLPNAYDGIATINKSNLGGDFDEAYDAPDFNNLFLAGRVRVPVDDGNGNTVFEDRIIPSFHRPSVINYLVNAKDWSDSPTTAEIQEISDALRRATFRPLPFANVNPRFTGGSSDFGLSTPVDLPLPGFPQDPVPTIARLDLLSGALSRGPWDVDNVGNGAPDSVWIDIGLPLITSPEGKLLRPLVAPMIEDTGGKLNLNAHGNYAQLRDDFRNNPDGAWASTTTAAGRHVFRGLGLGPAEIALPSSDADADPPNRGTATNLDPDGANEAVDNSELLTLLRRRNAWGQRPEGNFPVAGASGNDALDALRTGERRGVHTAGGGVGFSSDPFGRGGVGVGRTGQLLASVSGTEWQQAAAPQPRINETVNDPYERDPTGRLAGDDTYLFDELEAILRDNSWDSELLPPRLRELLRESTLNNAELAQMLTTLSTSFDHPSAIPPPDSAAPFTRKANYDANSNRPLHLAQVLLSRLRLDTVPRGDSPPSDPNQDRSNETEPQYRNRLFTESQRLVQIVGPELLQGRKLDVNRALGNGIDDVDDNGNRNGVVDEPREFGNGLDDNNNGLIDEVSEFYAALGANPHPLGWNVDAYPQATAGNLGSAVQNRFGDRVPDYNFGLRTNDLSASGRELLARHLYVLMMALMAELDQVTGERYEIPLIDETTVPNRQLYNARRIAQWAVNVVDYRDPDATVTRFVYDPDPLNGWDLAIDADGDGTPDMGVGRFNQNLPGADPMPNTPSPVVWGVESPELMFSEGHATHDVRVRDTALEGGGGSGNRKGPDPQNDDEHTDQVRIPQGSLFMELYCNRAVPNGDAEHLQGVPRELYQFNDTVNEFELQLDKIAPPRDGEDVGAPVWRIAISEPHYPGSPNEDRNPTLLRESHPDTASFDPERMVELDDGSDLWDTPLEYDRFILFNHVDTPAALNDVAAAMSPPPVTGKAPVDPEGIFFAHNGDNVHLGSKGVLPGQYLSLSPRTETNFGSQIFLEGALPEGSSPMRYELEPNEGMIQYDREGNRMTLDTSATGPIAPSVAMIIKTFRPDGWDAAVFERGRVGLNVSEPLPRGGAYYPQPSFRYDGGDNYVLQDAYVDYNDTANTSPLDVPQDVEVVSPVGELSEVMETMPEPFIGLRNDFCSAFLQRLADPLKPYDPVFNPYVTVDWMTIDLTSFSGEEDGADDELFPASLGEYAIQTRERNGRDANDEPALILFSYRSDEPDGLARDGVDTGPTELAPMPSDPPVDGVPPRENYFELITDSGGLDSSFGYLNIGPNRFGATLGSAGGAMNSRDRGQPGLPFALHPWLNRPYASHMELVMVPATSPGRLFEEFTPTNPDAAVTSLYHPHTGEVEQPTNPPASNPVDDDEVGFFHGRHRHLLNFFQGTELEVETAQFPRLLDYVTTLPRFRGEVDVVNPQRVTLQGGTSPAATGSRIFGRTLQPPFNFFHDGRRQGQINLNTLSDYPVWVGLMHGHLLPNELGSAEDDTGREIAFQNFQRSRRGYPVAEGNPYRLVEGGNINSNAGQRYNFAPEQLDGNFPTQYAGIYRNIADADLAPVLPDTHDPTPKLGRAGVAGSLLRQDADATATWETPLEDTPFFVRDEQSDSHRHVLRNPFAHYQTLMRMPNLVTKESQVFIVRLTMGLFEVDSDTLSLGREYKEDVAQNQRHQMLYIIDRSKPVGFIPGQDLNARDVVIYERRLQ